MAVATMDHSFGVARASAEVFVRGSPLQSAGSAQFATLHLVTRSLVDLVWAQRAATAGFPIQAYSLMRPAWEGINLCDLFAQEPDSADEWAAGAYRKFTPASVRKALGMDEDSFYSFMSERSHPRFAGLQMTIFKFAERADSAEPQRALLHLNDVPIEVTAAYMAVATPSIILARLATQFGRLNFVDAAHRRKRFAPMIRSVSEALRAGWHAMEHGLDEKERRDPEVRHPRNWADDIGGILDELADHVSKVYEGSADDPGSGSLTPK